MTTRKQKPLPHEARTPRPVEEQPADTVAAQCRNCGWVTHTAQDVPTGGVQYTCKTCGLSYWGSK